MDFRPKRTFLGKEEIIDVRLISRSEKKTKRILFIILNTMWELRQFSTCSRYFSRSEQTYSCAQRQKKSWQCGGRAYSPSLRESYPYTIISRINTSTEAFMGYLKLSRQGNLSRRHY